MVANFGWKFHIVVFTTNFLLLIVISIQAISPGGYSYFADFTFSVFSLIEHTVSYPLNSLFHLSSFIKNSSEQEKKIAELDSQLSELKIKEELYQNSKEENRKLRQLLELSEKADYKFLATDVIGYDLKSEFFKTIRIDKGKKAGIKKNYPVVTSEGIVGSVVRIGEYSSQVLIIVGGSSALGISIPEIKVQAVAYGSGGTLLKGKFIPISSVTRENLAVITSGLDGIFPGGLPVGKTTNESTLSGLYKEISILPYVNFYYLKNVFVLIPSKSDAP